MTLRLGPDGEEDGLAALGVLVITACLLLLGDMDAPFGGLIQVDTALLTDVHTFMHSKRTWIISQIQKPAQGLEGRTSRHASPATTSRKKSKSRTSTASASDGANS
eukprot:CAMPEP_0113946584 /NCGR_PEP_ID=MMETSP1339-20121228/58791_1 /TAXON_ID=94617 /ORGANISM="Fibrocapsa japonica" /LENGTH=105 /DNA_ID=CAMNT_0000952745 /DNA_START=18 /DNA_END=335 /DNA_ORIENTATION=+ /assembly_acc=CAM_ASM_000762